MRKPGVSRSQNGLTARRDEHCFMQPNPVISRPCKGIIMNPKPIVKTVKTECWDCGIPHHAHRTRSAAVNCIAKAAVRTLKVVEHLDRQTREATK